MRRQSTIAIGLGAAAVVVSGLLLADHIGPRWVVSKLVGYRGAGTVIVDESLPAGVRVDIASFAMATGMFGGQVERDLLTVPELSGQAGLALVAEHAAALDFSALNCEIIVLPRGWSRAELPSSVPFFRQGALDGAWVRVAKPELGEVWFVPGPGSAWSSDHFERGHDYSIQVNLNGGIDAAAGVALTELPDRIPVRLIVW